MNLPLARRLASEGLSLKDAAKRMGVRVLQLTSVASRHGIRFKDMARESDWEAPEGDPEALRQWYAGRKYNARQWFGSKGGRGWE